ncbi:hypothetical protein BC835DRAFT_860554 [Cytidiella melzeri]|nr:hypothetical protein BC835DRAFT_860554 [Cytidiella melzeri]
MAPINRLPPELLAAIFAHLVDGIYPVDSHCHSWRYSWPVQSVCSHWRCITSQTPAMWSDIFASYNTNDWLINRDLKEQRALVSASLVRSGSVPLTICFRGQPEQGIDDEPLVKDVTLASGRIRDLRTLSVQTDVVHSWVQGTTRLEVLVIAKPLEVGHRVGAIDTWHTLQLPKLRTLVADSFTGWHHASFGALRHLILIDQMFNVETLHGLHAVLASSPWLEDLVPTLPRRPHLSSTRCCREKVSPARRAC